MIGALKRRWDDASLSRRGPIVLMVGFVAAVSVTVGMIEISGNVPDSVPTWSLGVGGGLLVAISLLGVLSFINRQTSRVERLSRMAIHLGEEETIEAAISPSGDEIGQLHEVLVAANGAIVDYRAKLTEMHRFQEHVITAGPAVVFIERIPELTLTYLSSNATRVLGVDPEAVVGRRAVLRDLVRPDHRSRVVDAVTQITTRRRSQWKGVVARAVGDGPQQWLEMELRLDTGPGNDVASVMGYVIDVTDRVELEDAATEATFRYQSLFERIPSGIYRTTLDGAIVDVNPALARMLGYSTPDEVLAAPIDAADLYPDATDRRTFVDALLDQGSVTGFETELRRRSGETFWVSLDASLAPDGSGPMMIEGSAIDITARRRAEREAQVARTEANRANRAKSDFLSRMSHELRTPLNSIIGFSQLLEMRALDPRDSESVKQIHRAGKHLLNLINEVLDISRVESGRLDVSVEPVELAPVISDAVELMSPMADSRDLIVATDTEPDVWVYADRQRLKQVLLNVLSNAVKYNQRHGRIDVTVESIDQQVSIRVSDTGQGIEEGQMSRLFVPFDRLGAEHGSEEGTGLGLVLSQNLVKAMQGDLSVASTPGVGTVVAVQLKSAEAPEFTVSQGLDLFPPASPGRGSRTVLYIEDNTANLNLVLEVLALRPDIDLIPAINGQLGLDLARQHLPDVVLLDLNLPGLGGRDVLRELRADPSTRQIPIVVLSADATPRQIRSLRDAGADAYLTKPLDINLFLETLDRTLSVLT